MDIGIQCGVYRWLNIANEKSYVGSSSNLPKRKREHLRDLITGRHHSPKFQNAWNKYGAKKFIFEPLSYCSEDELLSQEQLAINTLDAVKDGYNVALIAGSPMRGRPMPQAAKDEISRKNTGRKCSFEHNKRISVALTGRKFSPETILRMSKAQGGKPHPWALGKKRKECSSATRELLSNSGKRTWQSLERKEKTQENTKCLYEDALASYLKHPVICQICKNVVLPRPNQQSKRWVTRLAKRIHCSQACANKNRSAKSLLEKTTEAGVEK